jgi:hypothetical protein
MNFCIRRATPRRRRVYLGLNYLLATFQSKSCTDASVNFTMTVCQYVTTREQLNEFLQNLTLRSLTKICRHITLWFK